MSPQELERKAEVVLFAEDVRKANTHPASITGGSVGVECAVIDLYIGTFISINSAPRIYQRSGGSVALEGAVMDLQICLLV